MALTHVLLFFHLLGAFCFFAGGAVVGVLQLAAIRRERPSEIHGLLRLAPFGAALVGAGALFTLGFGIALAEHEGLGFSPAWIQAALGLWVAAMALGGFGGRTARHARHLAEKLAAEGDAPSPELRGVIAARGPLWASYASGLLLIAILVLMVWQPGSPHYSAAIPVSVQETIARENPQLAYFPTRLPPGYEYAYEENVSPAGFDLYFTGIGQPSFGVVSAFCYTEESAMHTFALNGVSVFWSATYEDQQAWRCVDTGGTNVLIQASASVSGDDSLDTSLRRQDALALATLVAYAKPVG